MKMNDISKVKCGKCGFENILGTKKCVKCHAVLKHTRKGCPKCAKVNSIDAKKCVKCGYNFERKGNGVLRNLFFSLGIVVILALFLMVDKSLIKDIKIGFRIAAAFIILGIINMTLTYGSKDVIKFDAEEEIKENTHFKRKKLFSSLMIIIGIVIAAGFIIYYYFIK
jgi:ribosomal protein L40E